MRVRWRGNVFTEPLPRKGAGTFAYLAVYKFYTLQYYIFYYFLCKIYFRISSILIRQILRKKILSEFNDISSTVTFVPITC
jgi:hypothetical protein